MKLKSADQNLCLNTKNNGTESVNVLIRSHETQIEDWDLGKMAQDLYSWYDRFNKEFFDSKLGIAVLSFDAARISTLGHYVPGRNGIGIEHNINLNSRHLNRAKWRLLRTLLHEMLHQYQELRDQEVKVKRSNYHNKAFQTTAKSLGIPCDSFGHSIGPPTDPFVAFLKQHGVKLDNVLCDSSVIGVKGSSRLKKYSCQCAEPFIVRVADIRRPFHAKCNHCGQDFKPA